MAHIMEIAPDVYRISIYVPAFDMQFNHFLLKDEQPLLYHTGFRRMFPTLREAVARILDPSEIRWIGFSHFEVDECGALNEWLAVAPHAEPVCSVVGAVVNLGEYSDRPPRGMAKGDVLCTGRYRLRICPTPHLPHGWDASVLFEETQRTLFCSDLFHQPGDVEAFTESDVLERSRRAMIEYQAGPLMDYMPYTPQTERKLRELADLQPRTLAIMHGSSFAGDCAQALLDLGPIMRDVFGEGSLPPASTPLNGAPPLENSTVS